MGILIIMDGYEGICGDSRIIIDLRDVGWNTQDYE